VFDVRDLRYPSLYQINTRVWLTELSRALDRRATLDDIPVPALAGQTLVLKDLFGTARYVRDKNDLAARGLYLDLAPWAFHVFEITHEE
jgi:hypothetical protein